MSTGPFFIISALFYSILLAIIYFSKKRLDNIENKIYSCLILTTILGVILEIGCRFTIPIMDKYPFLNLFVTKGYLVYLLTWVFLFMLYTIYISMKFDNLKIENIKKITIFKTLFLTSYIICFIMIFVYEINYYNVDNIMYTYGNAVTFVYLVSFFCTIIGISCMLRNFKHLKNKKYLPMFLFVTIGTFVMFFQAKYPAMLLAT